MTGESSQDISLCCLLPVCAVPCVVVIPGYNELFVKLANDVGVEKEHRTAIFACGNRVEILCKSFLNLFEFRCKLLKTKDLKNLVDKNWKNLLVLTRHSDFPNASS
jgi:hypothetical protein